MITILKNTFPNCSLKQALIGSYCGDGVTTKEARGMADSTIHDALSTWYYDSGATTFEGLSYGDLETALDEMSLELDYAMDLIEIARVTPVKVTTED